MKPLAPSGALAVRRLVDLYAMAVDRCEGRVLADLFVEDGVLEAPRASFTGHPALSQMAIGMADRYRGTFHAVLNHLSWATEGGAAGETYCLARHFLDDEAGRPVCLEMMVRYQDVFRATPDGWRFVQRRLQVDATRTFPLDTLTVRQDRTTPERVVAGLPGSATTKSRAIPER